MKFISSANEYKAINLIRREPGSRYNVYKCVSRGRSYLLYLVSDEALERALVECFGDMSGSDFDGFAELFADGDKLVLAFRENILEKTAADYLEDDTGESEKLLFFERVLEALCVHGVPVNIACDLLENDNIGVRSDGSADCRYIFGKISVFDDRNMKTLAEIFTRKLTQAFSAVGKNKRTPIIERFCKELCEEPPDLMTEMYDRYVKCVEECRRTELGETKAERIKKNVIKAANIGKVVLTAAVLIMACIMLIISFAGDGSKNKVKFDRIGDVIIENV